MSTGVRKVSQPEGRGDYKYIHKRSAAIHKGGDNVMIKLRYQEVRPALGTIRVRELALFATRNTRE